MDEQPWSCSVIGVGPTQLWMNNHGLVVSLVLDRHSYGSDRKQLASDSWKDFYLVIIFYYLKCSFLKCYLLFFFIK